MERKQTHITYGLLTALAMIVINVLLHVAKLDFKPGMKYIGFIAFLVGIIMNAMAYSKANDTHVTFGQVFGSCFKATAIVTLITLAWGFISLYFLFPEIVDQGMEQARLEMSKNPKISEEQMETSLNMVRKNFKVIMAIGIIFGTLIVGAIFSIIGAAVAKKSPARPGPSI